MAVFHAVDPGFLGLDSTFLSVEIGFQIPIVSQISDFGFRSPRLQILQASILPNSGFQKQTISRNPDSLTQGDSLIHVFYHLTTICWFAVDLKEAMLIEASKSVSFISVLYAYAGERSWLVKYADLTALFEFPPISLFGNSWFMCCTFLKKIF